jgi:anti-repressor protein
VSALDIFTYSGQQVRTVAIDGAPWFVAADVCRILEHTNPTMALVGLDDDEKGLRNVDTLGGQQSMAVINEPGLYSLIIRSRKDEARAFKRWITHEVLPTIRKTGQFGSALPTNFAEALELAAVKVREIEALEAKAALDAPKVAAYDTLMDAEGFYTMEATAKLGGIGRNTLFARLREAGVIQSGSRLPYQRYMHWFKITASTWTDGEGVAHLSSTARVLPDALAKVLGKAGCPVFDAARSSP